MIRLAIWILSLVLAIGIIEAEAGQQVCFSVDDAKALLVKLKQCELTEQENQQLQDQADKLQEKVKLQEQEFSICQLRLKEKDELIKQLQLIVQLQEKACEDKLSQERKEKIFNLILGIGLGILLKVLLL